MSTTTELDFIHRYEPETVIGSPPLLMLHGTGGNEHDLVDVGRVIAPGSAILSPRGKVLEGGVPRFFRRLAEGVFDEDDVRRRANELADFVEEARERYGLAKPVAVGFSNGANIAAAMLLLRPGTVAGAVLLRAMVPLKEMPKADLHDTPVLMLSGVMDPIVPQENAARLALALTERGADVDHRLLPLSHGLGQADLSLSSDWIARR
ncbi:alpha/beta hydrolase [Flaviflagellibacter deserti]|uniref:Alpha/beta hydrolase n=1 Tax=Flaviflagellibacter deserti TaxID=2267266 RepID=A0ABV9YZG0_9HYPH